MTAEGRAVRHGGSAVSALERGFTHSWRIRIRYAETDAMGVVYHANYITFFEVGRVEYLRSADVDYRALEEQKMTGAVVEVGVRYHAPARFDDELSIYTRCASMGKVRFRMEYEIWREADRTLVVSGHTDHALLSHETLRPVRIPEAVKAGVARFEASRGTAFAGSATHAHEPSPPMGAWRRG